jgi:hypothetical protein
MTTDQERADASLVREIERAERCEMVLESAGMALSYHPLGYMTKKGVEMVAERLVISAVERFVVDLERQRDRQSGLEPGPRRDPSPSGGHGGIASPNRSVTASGNTRLATSRSANRRPSPGAEPVNSVRLRPTSRLPPGGVSAHPGGLASTNNHATGSIWQTSRIKLEQQLWAQ